MSMSTRSAETSVTFSLAELAEIERERVDEEEQRRARERERLARERREAEARRREAELAAIAAEDAARARRLRDEAAERARLEAREESARELARIDAEGRARIAADEAARAHELAVLRVKTDTGRRRLQIGLASALALVLAIGAAAAVRVSGQVGALERDADRLRDGQAALMRERDAARTAELAALDRRFERLRARPLAASPLAREARATAESARATLDPRTPDHARAVALGDALDAFEARLETLARLAALERRHDDLVALASDRRGAEEIGAANKARTEAARSDAALVGYERALDDLRDALARRPAVRRGPGPQPLPGPGEVCTDEHDPLCGLDHRRL